MSDAPLFDTTTETLLAELLSKKAVALESENYEEARLCKEQEQQMLLTGSTLARIRIEWELAVQEERYDDAACFKKLSMQQRTTQQQIMNPLLHTTSSVLLYGNLRPPPDKVVQQWTLHTKMFLHENVKIQKSSISKLCQDYKSSKIYGYEEMFMSFIEKLCQPDTFNLLKPIILELEAEMIVEELRQNAADSE